MILFVSRGTFVLFLAASVRVYKKQLPVLQGFKGNVHTDGPIYILLVSFTVNRDIYQLGFCRI